LLAFGLAIMMCGATSVFADIEPLTGNIDPESVSASITSQTKAIMPVHWAGYPCDMDEIDAIGDRHGLVLIEDAAHAPGADLEGPTDGFFFSLYSLLVSSHQASHNMRWRCLVLFEPRGLA
jgi:perosamine synthetase